MAKIKPLIAPLLFTFWSTFIISAYFFQFKPLSGLNLLNSITIRSSHKYYFSAIQSVFSRGEFGIRPTISPFLSLIIIITGFLLLTKIILRVRTNQQKLTLNLSPASYFIILLLIFFLNYLLWQIFHNQLNLGTIIPINFYLTLLELIPIIILTLAVGKTVFDKLFQHDNSLKTLLFSFGFGISTFVFCSFLLAVLGIFSRISVLTLFLLLGLLSRKNLIYWLKYSVHTSKIKLSPFDPRVLLVIILFIFTSFNLLYQLRPIPLGHDELETYFNTVKLISNSGRLVSGVYAYPWELFLSMPLVAFGNITVSFYLTVLMGIFVWLALYFIISNYCSQRGVSRQRSEYLAVLISTFFITLPAVTFQLSKDNKVDIAALFFAILGFISYLNWKQTLKNKSLFACSLFLGFALAIKYTLIFFIIPILLLILIALLNRSYLKRSLLHISIFLLILISPLLPFAVRNSIESIRNDKWFPAIILTGYRKPLIHETDEEKKILDQNKKRFNSNGSAELERYQNFQTGLEKYLKLPLIVTLNQGPEGQYLDIGFVLLLVSPLFLMLFVNRKPKKLKAILIMGSIYWLLWGTFAKGIIWYGFPGFLFLLILLAEILVRLSQNKYMYIVINSCFSLWFCFNLILESAYLPAFNSYVRASNLSYASGCVSQENYYESATPFSEITRIINNETQNKVYVVGKYAKYFIDNNDARVIEDNNLAVYMALSGNKNASETIQRFNEEDIRFVLIEKSYISFFGPDKQFFADKLKELEGLMYSSPGQIRILIDDKKTGLLLAQILN